jgi:hypothetical protein
MKALGIENPKLNDPIQNKYLWSRIDLDNVVKFANDIEPEYKDFWLESGATKSRVKEVVKRVTGPRNLALFQLREGDRIARIAKRLAAPLAFFTLIADKLAFANDVRAHDPAQEQAWQELRLAYEAELAATLRTNRTSHAGAIRVKEKMINYFQLLGWDETQVSIVSAAMELHINTHLVPD